MTTMHTTTKPAHRQSKDALIAEIHRLRAENTQMRNIIQCAKLKGFADDWKPSAEYGLQVVKTLERSLRWKNGLIAELKTVPQVRRLKGLLKHVWIYSGYPRNGYDKMSQRNRDTYDAISSWGEHECDF